MALPGDPIHDDDIVRVKLGNNQYKQGECGRVVLAWYPIAESPQYGHPRAKVRFMDGVCLYYPLDCVELVYREKGND